MCYMGPEKKEWRRKADYMEYMCVHFIDRFSIFSSEINLGTMRMKEEGVSIWWVEREEW